MKIQLLLLIIGLFNIIKSDGRLIQRNKTKTVEDIHTEKPNPTIRLTRDIGTGSLTGLASEEAQSEEFTLSHNRRATHFKLGSREPKHYTLKKCRIARDSNENFDLSSKYKTTGAKSISKPKIVLVKQPIPRFKDLDYDDFQSKVSNIHVITDAGDNEDVDFNLSDYDFDVNHDEFTSGRKHLEPRTGQKNKVIARDNEPNINNKIKTALSNNVVGKQARSIEIDSKKTEDKGKQFDYYDDVTTTTTAPQDEDSNEDDDSKETDKVEKREARSWNMNLLSQRSTNMKSQPQAISKILSILPLFPQLSWNQDEFENRRSSEKV